MKREERAGKVCEKRRESGRERERERKREKEKKRERGRGKEKISPLCYHPKQ